MNLTDKQMDQIEQLYDSLLERSEGPATSDEVAELEDEIDLTVSKGQPDVGTFQDVDEEQWMETMARSHIREVYREVQSEYLDLNPGEREAEPSTRQLLKPENIDTVYFSQQPWRPPFMAVELENCPEWAQITVVKEGEVRTKPGLTTDRTVIYFQVREGL